LGGTPLEGLTNIPQVASSSRRGRVALTGFRANAITVMETMRLALDALRAHKLRSFLTLLGIILAVTTLIAVMSVVSGMNFYVADRIANLGANVFIVDRFGIITSQDAWVKAQKRPVITMEDFERLRDNMKTARAVAALWDHNVDIRAGNGRLEGTDVMGVSPVYGDMRSLNVAQGRFITDADDDHHAEVTFVGADVADRLFPGMDPLGKTVRVETHTYQVVGVAERIGTAFGQSQDNFMIIPVHTFEKELGRKKDWVGIFVQAPNAEMMSVCQDEARMLMRAWRHLPYDAPDNFAILGSDSIMALWHQLTGTLAGVAVGLVSVFLVVGGIVIMNIMLASVTERTREIGIRRSLGARRKHILLQFMMESAVLAAVGGLIGIGIAYGVVGLVGVTTSIPVKTPLSAVITSLCLSAGVGLFFGIYPAMRAADLDPIEALRTET
jgi:putative ABC transport system permease protein